MRRVIVRRSPVHGRGVFARCALSAGERIIEYEGEVIGWRTAASRYQKHGALGHTYFFGLSDGRVIDGGRRGNSARWLNHACEPNCEAIEMGERVFIHAIAPIGEGQELFLDYRLTWKTTRTARRVCTMYVTAGLPTAGAPCSHWTRRERDGWESATRWSRRR